MSNISKIKISGTSYDIKDENACNVVELTQAEYDALPTTAKTSNTLFVITDAEAGDLSNYYTKSETSGATEISTALASKADTATTYTKTETDNAITAATSTKQDTLVSGTNIKTINNQSLLGEGNITIEGGGGGGKAIEAGRGISITTGETADTVSFNLPISAGTGTNNIKIGGGTSSGQYSLAGGAANPKSLNYASFAWGEGAEANVGHSTVFGFYSKGNGYYSFANGEYVDTNNEAEHSQGKYNVSNKANGTWGDSGNTLFSVGNGTASNARHNAFEIRQNGDIYITKDGQDVKLQDQLGGGGGSSYTAGDGIDITNDVISVTGKVDTTTYNTYTAATDTALASKQTTLTAGTNITIVDNVISATGGGSITIDPNLDSGSTNAVANSAITNAINTVSGDSVCNCRDFTTVESSNSEILTVFDTNSGGILPNGIYRRFRMPLYIDTADDNRLKLAINTSISSSSTDTQVPSAKAVYDALQEGGGGMTEDDELLLSTALTDLNDRKADKSLLSNYQKKGDYVTTNTLNTRLADYETALDEQNVEEVTAYALNDLNDRFGGLKLTKITESEYAALTTKDENTLYIVVADPSQTR